MAKKVEVEVDVTSNAEASIKLLRELRTQQKQLVAGSAEYNKVAARIKDVEDSLENAKFGAKSFKDQLEEAPGPIGTLFQGMKKLEVATSSFAASFKAAGIGLLVSLVAGVAAAFSQTEESGKKLQPLMIGFQKIFNGIFRALEPVFNLLVDLATQAMPFVTQAFGVAYSAMTSFLQGLGMLGRAIGKLIKGDFSGAWDDAKEAVTGFGDRYDEANKRFIAGTQELTKTEKENIKEREDAAKKALEERIKRMDTQDKLDKALMDKMKAQSLALAKTEEERLEVEKKFSKMAYEAKLKDLEDKQKLYKKDSEEYKALQIEKINTETEYINQTTALAEKEKTLRETQAKEQKEKRLKEEQDLREIRALSIQSQIEDLDRLSAKSDMDFQQDLERIAQKRDLLAEAEQNELANTELTEYEKTQIRKKYADERTKLVEQEIQTERSAQEARVAILNAYIGIVGQFGSFIGAIAGENKQLQKASVIIEKAAAIGQIIANTAAANAKAVLASPLTLGQPWVGINTASAALSVGTTIAQAAKAINEINAAEVKTGKEKPTQIRTLNYGDGGLINGPRHAQGGTIIEAEGGEAIMTRGAVTMFAPLLSALNQMGGGTSFAIGSVGGARPDAPILENPAMNQSAPIIKTYVVSNELTSEAERQARLKDLSVL